MRQEKAAKAAAKGETEFPLTKTFPMLDGWEVRLEYHKEGLYAPPQGQHFRVKTLV